jgi:hypothetical protein
LADARRQNGRMQQTEGGAPPAVPLPDGPGAVSWHRTDAEAIEGVARGFERALQAVIPGLRP